MRQKRTLIVLAALAVSICLTIVVSLSEVGQGFAMEWFIRLDALVERHFWPGLAIYIILFAALITLTLPLATVFIVAGGFLFGAGVGSIAALAGLSLAAILTFQAVRLFGAQNGTGLRYPGRANALFELMDRNAIFYVTVLRIVPVAPCFVINAGAAFTHLRVGRFALASMLGFIPSAVIYAGVGSGLETLLDAQSAISPALLLRPDIALPLLGVLALISVSWLLRKRLPGLKQEA